jgi:hypothetical protein
MRTSPTRASNNAIERGTSMVTVSESGAPTWNGLPPTLSASCAEGWSESSYTTANENRTSAEVIGWPSEKRAPRRRWNTQCRPSAVCSHDLARFGIRRCSRLSYSVRLVNIRRSMSFDA